MNGVSQQNEMKRHLIWIVNKQKVKLKPDWWCISVVPATWEAEARGQLEPRISRPA
jgi:hypothetical protein